MLRFLSHSLQGPEEMPTLHFLPFVQLQPTLPTSMNNSPSSPCCVWCITSPRTKQTATFPKTEIVFNKFRPASCLVSASWERCLQNPHWMLLLVPALLTNLSICPHGVVPALQQARSLSWAQSGVQLDNSLSNCKRLLQVPLT